MAVVLTTPRFRDSFVPRPGLVFRWHGVDGSVWNLTSAERGVALVKGAVGFGRPEMSHNLHRSPALHGASWRGVRADPRKLLLPLLVYAEEGEEDWLDVNRAWWKSMRADTPGTLECELPDGTKRTLRARFVADGDHPLNHDPDLQAWDSYVVEMIAEEPFWRGEAIERTYRNASAQDFYAPPDNVIHVSEMDTAADATIPNPGDHPAYPTWRITGPMAELVVGVGDDRHIYVDFPIEEGSELVIDTRPHVQSALLDGERVTKDLGADTQFAPVPRGENVRLHAAFLGTGEVTAELTPLHDSAY